MRLWKLLGPGAVYKHRSEGQGQYEATAGSVLQSAWGFFLNVWALLVRPPPPPVSRAGSWVVAAAEKYEL